MKHIIALLVIALMATVSVVVFAIVGNSIPWFNQWPNGFALIFIVAVMNIYVLIKMEKLI